MPLNIWYCEIETLVIFQVLLCLFVLKIDDGFKRLGIGRASHFSIWCYWKFFPERWFWGNKFFAIVKVIWCSLGQFVICPLWCDWFSVFSDKLLYEHLWWCLCFGVVSDNLWSVLNNKVVNDFCRCNTALPEIPNFRWKRWLFSKMAVLACQLRYLLLYFCCSYYVVLSFR